MYYYFKNFKPLPQWIKNKLLSAEIYHPNNWINSFPDSYANRQVVKKNGSIAVTQTFKRYGLDPTVRQWVRTNTYRDIIDCCICVSENQNQDCAPHRDRNRNFTLLWIIDAGGDSVETCFWQEQGKPVIREILPDRLHQQPGDYRTLIKLDSVIIPPARWMLLDARVLHSVENITGKRVSFQVSLDNISNLSG